MEKLACIPIHCSAGCTAKATGPAGTSLDGLSVSPHAQKDGVDALEAPIIVVKPTAFASELGFDSRLDLDHGQISSQG